MEFIVGSLLLPENIAFRNPQVKGGPWIAPAIGSAADAEVKSALRKNSNAQTVEEGLKGNLGAHYAISVHVDPRGEPED